MDRKALVTAVADAMRTRVPIPAIDAGLSLPEAYELQKDVTRQCWPDGTGGIKAGVTAPTAQQFFGVDQALIANLSAHGRLDDGCRIPFIRGRMLECELAVIIDAEGNPQAIAPAIEIVLVQFARSEDMTAANLVLSNLGADSYIVGQFQKWSPPYGEATVQLRRNDELINQAALADSLGGPEKSVPWICQEAQARHYSIGSETLLMTGACGKVIPAEVGHYTADFGSLGKLEFEIFEIRTSGPQGGR